MDIVERVKSFVEEECKKPSNKQGYEPFIYHFIPVVNYAKQLAEDLGGNKEIILIAAWLHDIGSIVYGREDHHITGAKLAEDKLKEFNYPEEKIELVKRCILNHRGSKHSNQESIEEQIVVEADALSAFENISGIFRTAFIYENQNQEEAKKSTMEKLENKWNQLHFESSKEIVKPKLEAARVLLK